MGHENVVLYLLFFEQELTSLKTKYEAKDYKSGKKHQKLNASKSVLPGNGAQWVWQHVVCSLCSLINKEYQNMIMIHKRNIYIVDKEITSVV